MHVKMKQLKVTVGCEREEYNMTEDEFETLVYQVGEDNTPTQCEHQLMRNGGNTYWICMKCEHVFHGGGEPLGEKDKG